MDVEKEREAFEAYMAEKYKSLMDRRQCLNNGGGYMAWDMNVAWQAWQAAKAQAVPEGFVLVPKEIPKSFDEGLYFYSNSISVVNEHSDGFIPMSDIDHSEIWKLVIEAQEPAND